MRMTLMKSTVWPEINKFNIWRIDQFHTEKTSYILHKPKNQKMLQWGLIKFEMYLNSEENHQKFIEQVTEDSWLFWPKFVYSGDLNTKLVWFLTGPKLSNRRMVRYLWKPFEYQTIIWILDYHLNTRHLNTRQLRNFNN